jgi:hypothetical protein
LSVVMLAVDDRTAYLVPPEPEALGDGLAELVGDSKASGAIS